jgi:hypothetical protein
MRRSLLAAASGVVLASSVTGLVLAGSPGPAAADTAGPAADGKGRIRFCVTGGGPLSVFADGPDVRTATLTSACRSFPVRPGQYYVGIQGYAVPDNCTLTGVTIRRGKYSYRAPEQVFTHIEPGRTTKVTFALDCALAKP